MQHFCISYTVYAFSLFQLSVFGRIEAGDLVCNSWTS